MENLTSGLATKAVKPDTSVLSATESQAVVAVPGTGSKTAVSKAKIPDSQVDKSQGSFAAINKLLHSFTTGTKTPKHEAKKASALTDAQVQHVMVVPVTLQILAELNACFICSQHKSIVVFVKAKMHTVSQSTLASLAYKKHFRQALSFAASTPTHCLCRLQTFAIFPEMHLAAALFTSCIGAPSTWCTLSLLKKQA